MDTSSSIDDTSLKVQINDFDSYQARPTKLDRNHHLYSQVPIIRIYGCLPTGHNITVHIHDVYPYLFIDYVGELSPEAFETNKNNLIREIEKKLQLSFKRKKAQKSDFNNSDDDEDGGDEDLDADDTTKRRFVADVSLCKGVPFYGYNIGYRAYFKIALLSPRYKTRLSGLLAQGEIFNRKLVTYESHLPFILQFLADYNLFGCDWLKPNKCYWRLPLINSVHESLLNDVLKGYLKLHINPSNVLDPKYERIGNSILEIDIKASFINNRAELTERDIHHNFLEKMYPEKHQKEEVYISSLKALLKDITFQSKLRGKDPSQFQDTTFTDARDFVKTAWMGQEELDSLFDYCKGVLRTQQTSHEFHNFVKPNNLIDNLPSIFKLLDLPNQLPQLVPELFQWSDPEEVIRVSHFENVQNNTEISWLDSYNDIIVESFSEQNAIQEQLEPQSEEYASDGDVIEALFSDENGESIHENEGENEVKEDGNNELVHLQDSPHDISLDLGIFLSQRHKRTFSQAFSQNISASLNTVVSLPLENSIVTDSFKKFDFEGSDVYQYESAPMDNLGILDTFEDCNLLKINYEDPTYSNTTDLGKPFIQAGKKFVVRSSNPNDLDWYQLEDVYNKSEEIPSVTYNMSYKICEYIKSDKIPLSFKSEGGRFSTWEYVTLPPSHESVCSWKKEEDQLAEKRRLFASQIEAITQSNDYKYSYESQKVKRRPDGSQNMTCLGVEIHVNTRGKLEPDPQQDSISAIFYKFDDSNYLHENCSGVLILAEDNVQSKQLITMSKMIPGEPQIQTFDNEANMVNKLLSLVSTFDPDILAGYEIHAASWGYIIERLRFLLDVDLCVSLSRTSFKPSTKFGDRWGYTHASAIKLSGRHMLNIWRLLRKDVNLTGYSIENVTYHLLHEKLPKYSNNNLTEWFSYNGDFRSKLKVLKYYFRRLEIEFQLIQVQELITRNTEQAKMIGIDFYSVFYRGSQYKIESLLARIAKAENFLLLSPTKKQVQQMRSLECISLIMEPESAFYKSPLIVLDFQSLYPSIMIGFNYCYSTLLGKLRGFRKGGNKIGVTKLKLPPGILELLNNENVTLSPNGYMFAKAQVRKSTLAKLLEEILDLRIKVKNAMKLFSVDNELTKLYNSKQLALKLIANVMYGYTSASFSGRMPNSDIADAIVSTGREILSHSIDVIEKGDWNAKVVYGDTDSLFVYLPGKSKEEAFQIGKQMSENITKMFPNPVKLKFEKVYHPCILLSKKRYVGYSYEYEDQKEPIFDAKGIETVRRDGIPAQQKMTEKALRILFETKDVSKVKEYVLDQFQKIMTNKVSIKDFCFAKEVRIGTYKNEKYLPPGAVVSMKKMEEDGRSEPQYRERVPYLVAQGYQSERIRDKAISPEDFLKSPKDLKLDYDYYITRVLIPPLERLFNLLGVSVKQWYKELPKVVKYTEKKSKEEKKAEGLGNYVKSDSCVVCNSRINRLRSDNLCDGCVDNEVGTVDELMKRVRRSESKMATQRRECVDCTQMNYGDAMEVDKCENRTCLTYYNRIRADKELRAVRSREAEILDLEW